MRSAHLTKSASAAQYHIVQQVSTSEARAQFSQLLRLAAAGEEITITKRGVPVAMLVGIHIKDPRRKLGMFCDEIVISDDFDAPLPEEILDAFEGKESQNLKKA